MNVLIYTEDQDVEEFKSYLVDDFPDVSFKATQKESEVEKHIADTDILVTLKISDHLLSQAKKLKWLQSIIAGTDMIETLPSFQTRKDIILTSSRGIHGPQMSEMAIMFMIALNRRLPKFVRNQDLHVWDRWPTTLLYQKKVAILGMGTVGQSLARKCKAFDMTVYGIGPNPKTIDAVDAFYSLDELNQVAADVDYFISVAPATSDNFQMLNEAFFAQLKPTAFFINIGRGSVVDEDALYSALVEHKIAGAAIDTVQQEPLPAENPLWDLDNLIITPHVGGMCDIYVKQAVKIFHENLGRYLQGERQDLVNLIPRK
ncbi:MAG: D-2-hydroxyacid dehydrogenase [Desulfuromusa sp.]|nr:D-2-hydroxyacid dehydrogenase [Desulfuromusa sp.]